MIAVCESKSQWITQKERYPVKREIPGEDVLTKEHACRVNIAPGAQLLIVKSTDWRTKL